MEHLKRVALSNLDLKGLVTAIVFKICIWSFCLVQKKNLLIFTGYICISFRLYRKVNYEHFSHLSSNFLRRTGVCWTSSRRRVVFRFLCNIWKVAANSQQDERVHGPSHSVGRRHGVSGPRSGGGAQEADGGQLAAPPEPGAPVPLPQTGASAGG